ncbi:hypothetical protein BBJ28_00012040 [Nothophytophthora sp. Chile5]|nr:hypothetical protein BBJ28_00012040 [Nothophytophthora sp. Chile5]
MAGMAMADAAEKAQAFAHRLVEFADHDACLKFFSERSVDFDRPNDMGWSVLMSVCACALMMACVAKNATAVQALLLELHASVAAVNMNGMTALMCAARASDDPRPGAPSHEELMARSAEIVSLLLSHGAEVSAVESAGGNTALHLAVLTKNEDAVKCLLASGSDIDLNWRNLAGNTAMDLSNRSSGVVSATIGELLSVKLAQREEAAVQQSEQVERELAALAMKEDEDAAERKVNGKAGSKKTKKSKKKAKKTPGKAKKAPNGDAEVMQERNEAAVVESRKASIGEKTSTPAKQQAKEPHHRISTSTRSAKKSPVPASRPASMPIPSVASPSAFQSADSRPTMTWVTEAKHDAPEVPRSAAVAPFSASPRSQQDTEDEADVAASTAAYDQLNTSFQRTFPVAAELEIGVEKFLIASSVSDRELEPTDSLSMSQIEALQEAHWQAYHYLNEKKVGRFIGPCIELTRVLEAQRVEAQFALQQELMQMK